MADRKIRQEMSQPWVEAFWQCRRMGLTINQIADQIGSNRMTIRRYLNSTGGIAPQRWKDPDRLLTLEERFRIKELLVEGHSLRHIARVLGRSPSTISREVKRGGEGHATRRSQYLPTTGQRRAWIARRRPKPLKIASNPRLQALVQTGLEERLSPEQIVGRLRREHPDDPGLHVSHETIYKTIYLQARGGLKRDLQALTRTGRTIRHPQRSSAQRHGRIKGMVSIWDRPAEALDRTIPGHWEGDLIVGKNGASAIATIVERHSNYLILVRLDPDKNRVEATTDGLIGKLADLPAVLKGSLTWDQGTEMTRHIEIAAMTGIEASTCTSPTPTRRGREPRTRTPTGCYASTSPKAPTSRSTTKTTSTTSPTR